jgi:acetyl-CoA/propionyl-CoA carboxylase, biotin carboxylase, biotin carboxyl carrier protein
MPTVLPFHRAVVTDPAFAGDHLGVHTRWIETEFAAALEPQETPATAPDQARERLTVEVGGKRLEVVVPAVFAVSAVAGSPQSPERPAGSRGGARRSSRAPGSQGGGDTLVTPMQGTIVKIVVTEGQQVSAGEVVVILEAMKMEQPLAAHKAGTITGLVVSVGQTVAADTEICRIKD